MNNMIYVYLIARDEYDCLFERRILTTDFEAYKSYRSVLEEQGNTVIEERIDENFGTLVVLPEDITNI